jgi:hypothetical protein
VQPFVVAVEQVLVDHRAEKSRCLLLYQATEMLASSLHRFQDLESVHQTMPVRLFLQQDHPSPIESKLEQVQELVV